MKLLADENISGILVSELAARGIDVVWVKARYRGASDDEIVEIAQQERRVILTSDKAFGERASRGAMTTGVILLRLHDVPPDEIVRLVVRIITSRDDWENVLAVIDRKRVRTIPLPVR